MKKIKKKIVASFLSITMILGLLAGCGSPGQTQTGDNPAQGQAQSEYREVTDLAGNTVKVPAQLKSVAITSWKGAFEIFVLLGHKDLVTSMADTTRYGWLREIYPELAQLPNYGSFDDVNVEELVKAQPDIIFSPEAAAKANAQMQSLNLPVYVDGVTSKGDPYEGNEQELLAIADLLGEKEKALAYQAWEKKWLDLVAERVKDIPDAERKTVLCLRNTTTEVFNEMNILGLSVSLAGGINVAKDAFSDKFYNTVDAEKLVGWNPDLIFQYAVASTGEELKPRYQEMSSDKRFTGITALKNGDFYIMPHGISLWGGKLENALGVLTLAKTMYPDLFKDINIKEAAQDFYAQFMNYEMKDSDWDIMVNNADGAKTLALD
ncbi:ABC transporter substrate-binding protein [Desulfitobacterium chlororespirans]|uniref:Substrate-binding protein n=1 Tax=Desulfitobacterium chlororespirans DSM 11544 TaxID=1121395 RepID=A0A1M7UHD7_9FIRM|nr:ABC transporter substrate-binding protein [Desulfitobacterium chlororespirans]SHN82354.1 substrate-binding protein [Desulfitobacterium chlororespirans DSM 11544]